MYIFVVFAHTVKNIVCKLEFFGVFVHFLLAVMAPVAVVDAWLKRCKLFYSMSFSLLSFLASQSHMMITCTKQNDFQVVTELLTHVFVL